MKIIKLQPSDYFDLEGFLIKNKLVVDNIAFPGNVIVNQKTYQRIKLSLKKAIKRQYPYLSKSKIEYSVGLYLLNYGPVILKDREGGVGLKTGHAIVVTKVLF